MKKIIFSVLLLLITVYSFAQQCSSDIYLQSQLNKTPKFKKDISNNIANVIKNRKQNKGANDNDIITIPVVFNLIYPSYYPLGLGANVHGSILQNQIDVLNQTYSGEFTGIDTRIRFCLAQKDIVGFNNLGIKRYNGNESYQPFFVNNNDIELDYAVDQDIKNNRDINFPSHSFLNIWIVNLLDVYGVDNNENSAYSSFPYFIQGGPQIDGIVINDSELGNTILTHEIGHWLGIFHIFETWNLPPSFPCDETDCESQGDLICDTDSVPSNGSINIGPGACNGFDCDGFVTNVVQNYMDYQIPDRRYCQNNFTLGQKNRMRDMLQLYRSNIYNNSIIGLNNYCYPDGIGDNGGSGSGYFDLSCYQCYEPYLETPLTLDISIKRLGNSAKNNLLINAIRRPNINSSTINEIQIFSRDCLDFTLEQTITRETSETFALTNPKSFIVNQNTFIYHSTNFNLENDKSRYYIFSKTGNTWSEVGAVFGHLIHLLQNNNETFMFRSTSKYSDIEVLKFNTTTNNFESISNIVSNNFDVQHWGNFGVSFSNNNLLIKHRLGGTIVSDSDIVYTLSEYEYTQNSFIPSGIFTFPQGHNIVSNTLNGNEMILYRTIGTSSNREYFLDVYKKLNNSWQFQYNININIMPDYLYSSLKYINENLIYFYAPVYQNNRYYFFKKNDNDVFEHLNLNHLNPNSITDTDFICSMNLSVNYELNEILLDDKIIKLFDITQNNNTCSVPISDVVTGNNITIGGENCNEEIVFQNVNKTFIAKNEIIFKPGVHIVSDTFLAKISENIEEDCFFTEYCYVRESVQVSSVEIEKNTVNNYYENEIGEFNNGEFLKIFPNPTNDVLHIESSKELISWVLIDQLGIIHFNDSSLINTKNIQINMRSLPKGVYYIKVVFLDNKTIKKSVIKN